MLASLAKNKPPPSILCAKRAIVHKILSTTPSTYYDYHAIAFFGFTDACQN
ncbi:MAG: hypothetical protein U5L45_03090 [Saprospiraceae bacterium]|nr:hypothetical protein [Saprospiraceae bacterium]